jgi:hypothetical protein
MRKTYWYIEFLDKKSSDYVPCFSPRYYGRYREASQWVKNYGLFRHLVNDKKLRLKITLKVDK